LQTGKTEERWIREGMTIYADRLKRYVGFDRIELPAHKLSGKIPELQQKQEEGVQILKRVENSDKLVLLDERGKQYTSIEFSSWISLQQKNGIRHIVFAVGGPFGFSDEVYKRADGEIGLSRMTFSHQMVRIFFLEQLYRGFTILRGEKYHHH
jgi:23S rRNA (pseudouridine1915-N3)-methyltransferase